MSKGFRPPSCSGHYTHAEETCSFNDDYSCLTDRPVVGSVLDDPDALFKKKILTQTGTSWLVVGTAWECLQLVVALQ